jgi:hypothetical protein
MSERASSGCMYTDSGATNGGVPAMRVWGPIATRVPKSIKRPRPSGVHHRLRGLMSR